MQKLYPDFKLQFEINNTSPVETNMEILGDETLLRVAIQNLFKNAYMYSDNKLVTCILAQSDNAIQIHILNSGKVPSTPDRATLFNTFTRGDNSLNIPGSGLGLRIVQRILSYHRADITYNTPDRNTNELVVSFSIGKRTLV